MQDIKPGYTRVSSILNRFKNLSQLPPKVLDAYNTKAEIGSQVHDAIDQYLQGCFVGLPEKARGYFKSFCLWWGIQDMCQVVCHERRFYCDNMKITGQIDLITTPIYESVPTLWDFKCTAAIDRKFWRLQAAFYHYLAITEGLKVCPTVRFLQLKANGGLPSVIDFNLTSNDTHLCQIFLNTYRYLET